MCAECFEWISTTANLCTVYDLHRQRSRIFTTNRLANEQTVSPLVREKGSFSPFFAAGGRGKWLLWYTLICFSPEKVTFSAPVLEKSDSKNGEVFKICTKLELPVVTWSADKLQRKQNGGRLDANDIVRVYLCFID